MGGFLVTWSARLMLYGALAVFLFIGGVRFGTNTTNNAWKAKEAQAARTANATLLHEVERGQTAQANLGQALQVQSTEYSNLERSFHELQKQRTPLVVRVPGAGPAAARAAGGDLAGAAPGAAASGPGCVVIVQGGQDEPAQFVLSDGALWVWNSALAGTDQPAGACGLADTSEAACAAASGVAVDDAITNHTENARLCSEDRVRHQHLIDFLTEGKKP